MSLDRLKWATIVLPILFMAALQACLMLLLEPNLGSTLGHWVALGVVAIGVVAFSTVVFRVLNGMQREIIEQNEQAQTLYEIGLKITSLQDIQQILRFIVDQAREMLGGETAALCLAHGNGGGLTLVGCSGPREAFRRLPAPVPPFPVTFLDDGEGPAATPDGACPAIEGGFRACHLSASLVVGTSRVGELCVSSRTALQFSGRHRELLAGMADMAAIAINNARLLERERYVAVLEERERLAQEMHDSLAQVLGYLHLKAQATKRHLNGGELARADDELTDMASLAHEAYLDVREAILGLRETVSPSRGIVGTLREYLQKFRRQAGIAAEIEVEGDTEPQFPPEAEVQLIRVIQEALTNVRKHARANEARIRIASGPHEIGITIEDKGRGFDPAILSDDTSRFGVRTMRERVERVGGRFQIESSPGSGTTVRIYLPVAEGQNHGSNSNPSG
jgi:signal transduction histidine kinase